MLMKLSIRMEISVGLPMGSMMRVRIWSSLELSSRADSSSSSGICMKFWRSRKMPKAFAAWGTICGSSVFSQPSDDIMLKMEMNVTCVGTMNATMTMANRKPRPLKLNFAKA